MRDAVGAAPVPDFVTTRPRTSVSTRVASSSVLYALRIDATRGVVTGTADGDGEAVTDVVARCLGRSRSSEHVVERRILTHVDVDCEYVDEVCHHEVEFDDHRGVARVGQMCAEVDTRGRFPDATFGSHNGVYVRTRLH